MYKQIDEQLNQINFWDERFYTLDGKNFYPSVTYILESMPKPYFLMEWIKAMGYNADIYMDKAANEGSQVHNAFEDIINGHTVSCLDQFGKELYDKEVWMMILKCAEFLNQANPTECQSESQFVSQDYGFAGTIDLTCMIGDQRWMIDLKTSNNIYLSHELQLSAYTKAWNKNHPNKQIDRVGILHLKAQTRGERAGKIQGRGWQLKDITDVIDERWEVFQTVHKLFTQLNPDAQPKNYSLPMSVQINNK